MYDTNNIIDKINERVKPGTFGITLVTLTDVNLPKTNNPLYGRVTKFTITANAQLGISYKSQVENRSNSEEHFHAQKQSGQHYYDRFFNVSDRNADQYYLRVGYRKNSSSSSTYMVDGREATPAEIEIIKSYQKPQPMASTQLAYGVTEEVIWRTYKEDNVLQVYIGDNLIFVK